MDVNNDKCQSQKNFNWKKILYILKKYKLKIIRKIE